MLRTDKVGNHIGEGDYVRMSGITYQLIEHDFGFRWYGKMVTGGHRGNMIGVWADICQKISPEEVMFEIMKG